LGKPETAQKSCALIKNSGKKSNKTATTKMAPTETTSLVNDPKKISEAENLKRLKGYQGYVQLNPPKIVELCINF